MSQVVPVGYSKPAPPYLDHLRTPETEEAARRQAAAHGFAMQDYIGKILNEELGVPCPKDPLTHGNNILGMIELRGCIDENGNKRFAGWLEGLDAAAAAKVTIALARMEQFFKG